MRDLTPEECEVRNTLTTQPCEQNLMRAYEILLDWGKNGKPKPNTPEWELFAEKWRPLMR